MFAWATVPQPPVLPPLVNPTPVFCAAPLPAAPAFKDDGDWKKGFKSGWKNACKTAVPPSMPPFMPVNVPASCPLPPVPFGSRSPRIRINHMPDRAAKEAAWRFFSTLNPQQKKSALEWGQDNFMKMVTSAQQDEWESGQPSLNQNQWHQWQNAHNNNGWNNDWNNGRNNNWNNNWNNGWNNGWNNNWNNGWGAAGGCGCQGQCSCGGAWFA